MTWRDKLEIGLKEDAPFRKDNLPKFQVRGKQTPSPVGPDRSPVVPAAREDQKRHPRPTRTAKNTRLRKPPAPGKATLDKLAEERWKGEGGESAARAPKQRRRRSA